MSELNEEKVESLRLDQELEAFLEWADEHVGDDEFSSQIAAFTLALIENGSVVSYRLASSYLRWVRARPGLAKVENRTRSCSCVGGWVAIGDDVRPCETHNQPGYDTWTEMQKSTKEPWA